MKIRLENVSKSLSFKEHFNARAEVLHLLDGINFELDDGENLAILGQSGSGKSTLAKLISFSEPKSGGKIYINNEEITDKNELKKDIRYILQNQKQALNPALKVKTAIAHVRSYLKLSFSENELKELMGNLNLKDEILEKKNIQEFIEEIYDNKYLKEKSSNIVIARAKDVKGEVSSYTYEEDGKTKTKKRINTEANLEILGQLKGNIKEKNIKMVLKNTGIVPKEKYIRIVSDEKLSDEEDKKYKYIEEKDIEQKVFLEEGKIYLFFLKYNSKENVYESGYPDAYIRELNKISKKRLVELIEVYNGSGKMSDEIEVRKTKEEGFEKLNKVI